MDKLEEKLKKSKTGFVRIDGKVSDKNRHERVQQFQSDKDVRVAILSITAASQGLTLTAASSVVFAELTWTPSIMNQAEDRAHRIGQKNSVNIYYMHGRQTLDDLIFALLNQKSLVTTDITDGRRISLGINK